MWNVLVGVGFTVWLLCTIKWWTVRDLKRPKTGFEEFCDGVSSFAIPVVGIALITLLNAVPPGYLPDFSSKTSPSVSEQVDPLTEDPDYSTYGTAGPLAQCLDGTYSYAVSHQGACSHHGGVAVFYR